MKRYIRISHQITKGTWMIILCVNLKKSLYVFKQSSWVWYERFARVMIPMGYQQCQVDHTLFIKHSSSRNVMVLLFYVENIIVIGDDDSREAPKEFEIKTLEG